MIGVTSSLFWGSTCDWKEELHPLKLRLLDYPYDEFRKNYNFVAYLASSPESPSDVLSSFLHPRQKGDPHWILSDVFAACEYWIQHQKK